MRKTLHLTELGFAAIQKIVEENYRHMPHGGEAFIIANEKQADEISRSAHEYFTAMYGVIAYEKTEPLPYAIPLSSYGMDDINFTLHVITEKNHEGWAVLIV